MRVARLTNMFRFSFFCSDVSRGTEGRARPLLKPRVCLFRGDRQGVTRSGSAGLEDGGGAETVHGREGEAEDRRAARRGQAGVWPSSEAVPERPLRRLR